VDVRTKTGKVTDLLKIQSDTHAPPILLVSWSSLQFTCVLSRATQKFLLFMGDGTPVRARLNVTFQEYADPERQAKEDHLQSADLTKLHTLVAGETLDALAATYYHDATLWRPLAIANGLDDPSRLDGLRTLIVPALPYRNPVSGEVVP
jgi:nucleoid-associated protein YgaU